MKKEENVDEICRNILEMVSSDIVSMAELRQLFDDLSCSLCDTNGLLKSVLLRVLESGVEIGCAINRNGNYVEFIGWQGSSDAKVARALALVSSDPGDADYGVWLAWRANVDCYEAL